MADFISEPPPQNIFKKSTLQKKFSSFAKNPPDSQKYPLKIPDIPSLAAQNSAFDSRSNLDQLLILPFATIQVIDYWRFFDARHGKRSPPG
jgi:hypothetical protein